MKKSIVLFSLTISFFCFSQQVQYASKVIKFSSDLGGKQNGIKRILGKPDAFPQGGASANAWTPKKALDGRQLVEVGFEKPQTVKQVAIFENLNAGCVTRIWIDTGSGKYELVWSRKINYKTPYYKTTLSTDRSYYFKRKRRKVQDAPDVYNPGIENAILENAVSSVVAVKVEFSFALLPGEKQIDAIGISDSETPLIAIINTTPKLENLPNSQEIETGNLQPQNPVLTQDKSKLLFTTKVNEVEKIYSMTKKASGYWSNPQEEDAALNANANYNYIEAFTNNFILKGGVEHAIGTGESGYEFLKYNNGKYESLGKLIITAYSNYDDTSDATITSDRKTILMGIESDMTQGGTDIYFTNKKEDGSYSFLTNAGKTINSAADEGMPFLLSDTKTLLFCSNGFSSFGNYDIYCTQRLDDTWKKWSEPLNLGSKINSAEFDGAPFYDETSEMLYYTTFIGEKSVLKYIKIPKNYFEIKQ
ncbi:hypothetical protein [Flavobacterium sp.]|uniref:hypothetical protein n=1 Tax=Flavobacterium sp. TaxID=239 RepID=UPI0025FB5C55|nr:hypothetical protein [Flavobacterium sp.]